MSIAACFSADIKLFLAESVLVATMFENMNMNSVFYLDDHDHLSLLCNFDDNISFRGFFSVE